MWHKARAQPRIRGVDGISVARWWSHFKFHFANVSRKVGAWDIRCPKSVEAELGGRPAKVSKRISAYQESSE
jgi:hypothetical protein